MKEFFTSRIFKLFVCLFIVLFAFMLRATMTEGFSNVVNGVVGTITTPFQKAASSLTGSVSQALGNVLRADELAEENERLREENRQLIPQMADYETYKNENETLRRDLGIKEANPELELTKASVIGRDPVGRFYSFSIDKGSLDGVAVRDPVITADGLVGIVSEVGPVFSKVTTILDVGLNVACRDVRTQDVAILSGDIALAEKGQCKVSLLPRESGAAKGDIIETTSTSGLFPEGLILGRITEVGYESDGMSLYAVVQPTNDIKNIKDVMVITGFRGQGSSLQSFQDAAQDQVAQEQKDQQEEQEETEEQAE